MPFDLGATARLTAECRDPGGDLITAASAAVVVTLPDGTTVSPPTEETSTPGVYQADHVTTAPGRHTVRWLFTGPAHAYTDMFDVNELAPPALMSLATGRKHLKKAPNDTADDEEIRDWIEACTRAVEQFVGPVVVRQVSDVLRFSSARSVALTLIPALDIVAVTQLRAGGPAYTVDDLVLDPETGLVEHADGGLLYGPLRVDYRVGRLIVPANFRNAGKIILQHLWKTRQGPGRPQRGVDDYDVTEPLPGLGFAIPNRAVQLLDPDRLPPGVG
ncbi:hypothetical protein OH540_21320 [Streptomyces sp. BPPL-273]|uniref:hypothetical protein n=1 Tax=Streptomyces sp. BPPL-273 TaxID=2987533 RepID=UPI0024AFB11A|nr:hypothetical protein [Streptomyces sp. BPPL-273]WHM32446.1 hypothetical protein OH540_21320 [Streptomyces sp. BPPL-273]